LELVLKIEDAAMTGLACVRVIVAIILCAGWARAENQNIYDEKADAHEQIRAALREASRSRKNIILDFGGNWCLDCHVLDEQMHQPELASLVEKNYVVVHIDIGRFDKNQDLAKKYGVPLDKGVPALAVLDPRGNLLYAQDQGQFEDARHLDFKSIKAFFEKWTPKRQE
jgi:thiol:disulfide interchange protein